jgi:hypothetical protein
VLGPVAEMVVADADADADAQAGAAPVPKTPAATEPVVVASAARPAARHSRRASTKARRTRANAKRAHGPQLARQKADR